MAVATVIYFSLGYALDGASGLLIAAVLAIVGPVGAVVVLQQIGYLKRGRDR